MTSMFLFAKIRKLMALVTLMFKNAVTIYFMDVEYIFSMVLGDICLCDENSRRTFLIFSIPDH